MKNKENINNYSVLLGDISKEYSIHHEKPTLVEKFFKGRDEKFFALKNLTLKIKRGDTIGIVGDNGSGKTTLLKIIAGITTPTTGKREVFGRVISLIDLNAGFHDDLSGYQNIYLNGMLLGMERAEINKNIKSIINLAGIGRFIDAPFFTYSQGMKLRLGFSVAVHSDPDILLLDENFSVGDEKFGKKSVSIIENFTKQNKTIIIASHWKSFIKQNCKKIVTLKNGHISSITYNKNSLHAKEN